MIKARIKTCPYCGGNASMSTRDEGRTWSINCGDCPATMTGPREENPRLAHCDRHDALIDFWNSDPRRTSK